MLLGRVMQFSRKHHRRRLRLAAAAGGAALLTLSVSACSATERLTTGMKVRSSVVKLGDQPAATVTASVDGSPEQAYRFLAQVRGGTGEEKLRKDAVRLARAEVTLAAGSGDDDTPLKEMPASDAADVAAAMNFGGTDALAVKSVRDRLYLRVRLKSLVRQTDGPRDARRAASEIVALADDLPTTLGAAKDALKGEWVRADPDTFDDFARTAEMLAARAQEKSRAEEPEKDEHEDGESDEARRSREIRDAVTVGSALDGQSQREFVSGVQELLREHATFADKGERDGAEHVRLTLPGRKAADDLVAALRPLGAEIAPSRVPGRDITADLAIRRGQLTTLTLDLGQFTGKGVHLPLRLDFGSGGAVSVRPPGGTKELEPQDLVAALMYGALGTENF